MSSTWNVQSGRDSLGTLRTSPHQIAQTCACLSGARTIGPPQSVPQAQRPPLGEAGAASRPGRPRA